MPPFSVSFLTSNMSERKKENGYKVTWEEHFFRLHITLGKEQRIKLRKKKSD